MSFRALIASSYTRTASNNCPYITLELYTDPEESPFGRQARARRWQATPEDIEILQPAAWIIIEDWHLDSYNHRPYVVINSYRVIPPPQDSHRFLKRAHRDKEELWQELLNLVNINIGNENVKRFVLAILEKHKEEFSRLPAARTIHHNYFAGLLEHTVEVVRIASAVAEILLPNGIGIDQNVLMAGAVLHDLGKLEEYTIDEFGVIGYNEGVRYTGGHSLIGRDLVLAEINDSGIELPQGFIHAVIHLILSHHGREDWGAVVPPASVEAIILHFADMISSKANRAHQLTSDSEPNSWSEGRFELYNAAYRIFKYRES